MLANLNRGVGGRDIGLELQRARLCRNCEGLKVCADETTTPDVMSCDLSGQWVCPGCLSPKATRATGCGYVNIFSRANNGVPQAQKNCPLFNVIDPRTGLRSPVEFDGLRLSNNESRNLTPLYLSGKFSRAPSGPSIKNSSLAVYERDLQHIIDQVAALIPLHLRDAPIRPQQQLPSEQGSREKKDGGFVDPLKENDPLSVHWTVPLSDERDELICNIRVFFAEAFIKCNLEHNPGWEHLHWPENPGIPGSVQFAGLIAPAAKCLPPRQYPKTEFLFAKLFASPHFMQGIGDPYCKYGTLGRTVDVDPAAFFGTVLDFADVNEDRSEYRKAATTQMCAFMAHVIMTERNRRTIGPAIVTPTIAQFPDVGALKRYITNTDGQLNDKKVYTLKSYVQSQMSHVPDLAPNIQRFGRTMLSEGEIGNYYHVFLTTADHTGLDPRLLNCLSKSDNSCVSNHPALVHDWLQAKQLSVVKSFQRAYLAPTAALRNEVGSNVCYVHTHVLLRYAMLYGENEPVYLLYRALFGKGTLPIPTLLLILSVLLL